MKKKHLYSKVSEISGDSNELWRHYTLDSAGPAPTPEIQKYRNSEIRQCVRGPPFKTFTLGQETTRPPSARRSLQKFRNTEIPKFDRVTVGPHPGHSRGGTSRPGGHRPSTASRNSEIQKFRNSTEKEPDNDYLHGRELNPGLPRDRRKY